MGAKSITYRWILNSFGVILAVLIALEIGFAFFIRNYYYSGIRQALISRSVHINTVFTSSGYNLKTDFEASAREFMEGFTEKEKMELMIIDKKGNVVVTSGGFTPDREAEYEDFQKALKSNSNYGIWIGKPEGGENIIALTKLLVDTDGEVTGAVRYIVSLSKVDQQIFMVITVILLIGLAIIFFMVLSGTYFIKSIVNPVRKISTTARRIALGDLDARILEKYYDDEIGELCDTINYMAGELSAAERIKNDFISSVSHELRTPLTAIKGWGETILSSENDQETIKTGINVIIRESERLSGIVEELLDFSRIQSGRLTLRPAKMDILAELGEAVVFLKERARYEGIELIYDEPEMLPFIIGDKDKIKQVFVIILDNAIKYSDPGDTVTVSARHNGENVIITIKDTGCGIPEKDLPMVKEKFYKGNHSRRGSGIGLAIADEIIAMHSGKIDIESQVGVGTTVTITIPVESSRPEEQAQAERSN